MHLHRLIPTDQLRVLHLWLGRCRSCRANSKPRPRDDPVTSATCSALPVVDTGAALCKAQALSCRGACKDGYQCHAVCTIRPRSLIILDDGCPAPPDVNAASKERKGSECCAPPRSQQALSLLDQVGLVCLDVSKAGEHTLTGRFQAL